MKLSNQNWIILYYQIDILESDWHTFAGFLTLRNLFMTHKILIWLNAYLWIDRHNFLVFVDVETYFANRIMVSKKIIEE